MYLHFYIHEEYLLTGITVEFLTGRGDYIIRRMRKVRSTHLPQNVSRCNGQLSVQQTRYYVNIPMQYTAVKTGIFSDENL